MGRQVDILEELLAAGDATSVSKAYRFLRDECRIPRQVLNLPHPFGIGGALGVCNARANRDGTWTPAEIGAGVIVIGIWDAGELIDLLALAIGDPEHWRLRIGLPAFLGAEAVDRAHFFGEPLVVRRNPLSWLRGGCEGAVALDWRFARTDLIGLRELFVEDLAHAEAVEARLRQRDPRLPRISLPLARAA